MPYGPPIVLTFYFPQYFILHYNLFKELKSLEFQDGKDASRESRIFCLTYGISEIT